MLLKKTVGIITTFRQANFGSVLQAFSLQYIIDNLGFKSYVIDYRYPNSYHYAAGKKHQKKHATIKSILRPALVMLGLKRPTKMQTLNQFIAREMNCTKKYATEESLHKNPPIFDIYVSGSDQIWNPNTMFGDMSYFLDFAVSDCRFSYSSSFSCDSIPAKYEERYRQHLTKFKVISVRENNGCKIVKELTGRNDVQVVLDPTLLLSRDQWDVYAGKSKLLNLPQKYILFYMLAYTYDPQDKMTELLSFAQNKYSLPVISVSPKPPGFKGEYVQIEDSHVIGNYEFLYLVKNAAMVITSSFHGTAFALNFGVPFFALMNGKSNSDDRISTIVEKLSLTSQLIKTDTVLNDNLSPYYNTHDEQLLLQIERDKSICYLKSALHSFS